MTTRMLTGSILMIAVLAVVPVYGQQAALPPVTAPQAADAPVQPPAGSTDAGALGKGSARYNLGEYEEALDLLKQARVQDPKSSLAAFYLGMTYKKMEDFTRAIQNLKDAVTIQPPVKEAFIELADSYYAVGKNDEALHSIEVAEREGLEPAQTAYLKGLVLLKKKRYPDAAASLEKSKTLDPKLAQAVDYQLAFILARQGKTGEALALYQNVAAKDPESSIADMAKQQIEFLSRKKNVKKSFTAAVDLQYQHDSNVILKPDSTSVATNVSNQSDNSTVATVRAEYAPQLDGPYGLNLQYAFYMNAHQDLKAYDMQMHTLSIAPTYRIGQNTAQLQLSASTTSVDKEKYLQSLTLTPMYSFVTGEEQYAQAYLRYQKKDFQEQVVNPDENRDGSDTAAGLSWYHLVAQQKGYLNLKYEINKESTTGKNWSYLGNKVIAGALYPAAERLQVIGTLEAYLQAFDATNTVFQKQRKDTTVTAQAQLLYAITPIIDLHFQFMYIKNTSSIDVYGYNKNVVGLGVYAKF